MAECGRCTSGLPSSGDMTSLARALSHTTLSQLDQSDAFQSQSSLYRMGTSRRRRVSASPSVDSVDVSPSAEARVLVINTGGTIGMMYHNEGKHTYPQCFAFLFSNHAQYMRCVFILCVYFIIFTQHDVHAPRGLMGWMYL